MKKTKILTFSFISLLAISQVSFINSKNILIGEVDNPYVPYSDEATTYSGKSFDLVDQNNSTPTSSFFTSTAYIQIIDNEDQDVLNNLSGSQLSIQYNTTDSTKITTTGNISPTLSNVSNDTYYFSFYTSSSVTPTTLAGFNPEGQFAIGSNTQAMESNDVPYETINTQDETPIDITNYDITDEIFPTMDSYETDTSIFNIDEIGSDGSLTFTIKVNNWTDDGVTEYLQQEDTIGVTLVNNDEPDDNLKYEQYQANFISSDNGYYTYKIDDGLSQNTNYDFYSINYSGITSSSNSSYSPQAALTLNAILNIPTSVTSFGTSAYIDPTEEDVFKINSTTVTSIEFSLKVVDVGSTFTNSLSADNTMDVSVLNIDTTEQTVMDATFVSEDSGVFTFRIDNLVEGTNYQIISLDNTDLYVNGIVDENILLVEDLGLVQEDTSFITTNTDNAESKDGNVGIIVGSVVGFVFLVALTFGLYYFFKKNNKKKA